jgi:hypothetical protein
VVDPSAAGALVDAWRRGSARAGSAPAARLIPAPRRALESSARLDLTHRLLTAPAAATALGATDTETPLEATGPETPLDPTSPQAPLGGTGGGDREPVLVGRGWAGGRATAGDVAYLRGDHGTALWAYRRGVVERPEDDAAWAGLALVCPEKGLKEQLEVVAAVYRALDDPGIDPITLAAWISA